MKLFIIPSWYPSQAYPSTGIFFKEQAQIIAREKPDWKLGISLWGSHEPSLWIRFHWPLDALIKLTSRFSIKAHENMLEANCIEFFSPAHTWTRSIKQGNMEKIIKANEENLDKYVAYFGKPDMILAEITYPAGWIAKELSEKYDIPFIIREQMSPFPLPSFRSDFEKLLLPPLRSAKAVLTVGKNLREELKEYEIDSGLTVNFIDTDFFDLSKNKASGRTKIFALGRLVEQKGFDLLLRALGQLKDQNWELRLGGSGPLNHSLKRLAKREQIQNRIRMQGELDRLEVKKEMQTCDFFVLPSRHESFGVVLIEAMACGKPIVTTRCGGITGDLPDLVAIRCEADISSLASTIGSMLDNLEKYDPVLIRNFVLNRYSVDQAVMIYEKIFAEIS